MERWGEAEEDEELGWPAAKKATSSYPKSKGNNQRKMWRKWQEREGMGWSSITSKLEFVQLLLAMEDDVEAPGEVTLDPGKPIHISLAAGHT